MNILCRIFGHKTNEGIYSGAEYMRITWRSTDGIGREHAGLMAKCPRCGQQYGAGSVHLPREDN